MNPIETDFGFEDEVRRIARQLWPSAEHGGAAKIGNRERDGIFETEDIVHLIECTTSRSKEKAVQDSEKLAKLSKVFQKQDFTKAIKCWFVTRDEPTADQRDAVKKHGGVVVAIGFDQFRAKLVDVRSYLEARNKYPFGSVRDPASGHSDYELGDYVALDMVEAPSNRLWSFDQLRDSIASGKRIVLLGDYGAGKSSTLRQLFKELAKIVWRDKTVVFPVMLNLRDHHGQTDPAEVLERHAKRIGLQNPYHLVRAWRAGYVTLFLDGFDEVATAGWAGRTRKLQDLRYQSMELLRHLIRESPSDTGILISGRAHFFDDLRELQRALGLDDSFVVLNLNEFTDEQVSEYLKKKGWHESIPDWLPSRPLLLGYLASKNLLKETLSANSTPTPAAGWHVLLNRICKRESEIEVGVDPDTIRRIIERLATFARKTNDGLGPLLPDQVTQAFIEVVGQPPDDRGHILIQRLPGLGVHVDKTVSADAFNSQDGSRRFIDQTFAEAAASGDVFRFIEDPHHTLLESSQWVCSLQPLGVDILAHRCSLSKFNDGKISAALTKATSQEKHGTLAADIVRAIIVLGFEYTGPKAFIRGVEIPEFDFNETLRDLSELQFQEIVVHHLVLDADADIKLLPTFENSIVAKLDGRTGWSDIPTEKFIGTEINHFEDTAASNATILCLDLPAGTKVLLTILRKLYVQMGRGRQENALYRGLDSSVRHLVSGVLKELRREGFLTQAAYTDNTVWLTVRSLEKRQRALQILAGPHESYSCVIAPI